jgi:cardiolipin synthase A/B
MRKRAAAESPPDGSEAPGNPDEHAGVVPAHSPAAPAPALEARHEGPSFARGLWRIAAADASSGNRVALLVDGPRTFEAMLAAIEGAKRSVALESYIFRNDRIGERFADALAAAAKRGVQTRVLADWIGTRGTRASFWRRMREQGAEVRIFNPPGFRAWLGLVPRDHRKLLVVDSEVGVTGGVGLGEEWSAEGPRGARRKGWRDTAVRIEGPAARDMLRAFESMWKRAGGEERRTSRRRLVRASSGAHVDPHTAQGAVVGIIEGDPFRLRIGRALQIQAVSAQRFIYIASAYFVPSYAEVEALAGAARDGVDVRVLVPSRYDHPWVRRLTTRFYRRLLDNGVRIWEWSGEMMHAKTSVMDGRWVRVGSTDLNPLGIAINYELDALIEDAALGAEAEELFRRDLTRSIEIRGGGPV